MRVLVCGSRTWNDYGKIVRELVGLGAAPHTIIEGGAKGADLLAQRAALALNWPWQEVKADWDKYGRAAGMIRNKQMLVEGQPDLVLAFWDGVSRGTANMIELAKKANIPVKVILED